MVDEISERISEWLPADLTAEHEIQAAIRDSGWSEHWDDGTTRAVSDFISSQRDVETPEIEREARGRTTVMGPQGDRTAAIRAADGTTLGDPDDVTTWEDRWGNIMGRNTRTGTTKKVTDSDDR